MSSSGPLRGNVKCQISNVKCQMGEGRGRGVVGGEGVQVFRGSGEWAVGTGVVSGEVVNHSPLTTHHSSTFARSALAAGAVSLLHLAVHSAANPLLPGASADGAEVRGGPQLAE